MPYDSELDKKVYSESWESDATRVSVGVFSYNNGPKKIQISRENKDGDGNLRFAKLGRMTKEELAGVMPFIQAALKHMD